jgi:hypothetical protein
MESVIDNPFDEEADLKLLKYYQNKYDVLERSILSFTHLRNCSNNPSYIRECENTIKKLEIKRDIVYNKLPRSFILDD